MPQFLAHEIEAMMRVIRMSCTLCCRSDESDDVCRHCGHGRGRVNGHRAVRDRGQPGKENIKKFLRVGSTHMKYTLDMVFSYFL